MWTLLNVTLTLPSTYIADILRAYLRSTHVANPI
jgi:hypothetical protein